MAKPIVEGELYATLTGQLFEIGRQLRQRDGYPYNPWQLKVALQAAIEGRLPRGELYTVRMGGATTADHIAQAWRDAGLPRNAFITAENFPFTARAEDLDLIEILDLGYPFSEKAGLAYLKAVGLKRPTYEHWLRFAEQHGRTTTGKKPYVIFLFEPWIDPNFHRRTGCVNRDPGERELLLDFPDSEYDEYCVLAGVRPREQPQA